jgi:hypothetical protein
VTKQLSTYVPVLIWPSVLFFVSSSSSMPSSALTHVDSLNRIRRVEIVELVTRSFLDG